MSVTGSAETVTMICPNLKCRKVLRVPGQYRGQHVKCSFCRMAFAVPPVKKTEGPSRPADDSSKKKK